MTNMIKPLEPQDSKGLDTHTHSTRPHTGSNRREGVEA